MNDKILTKAELQIMQILWKLEHAFVNDILEGMPTPKPAYNTVSTIVRILVSKGFVGYESFGKSHRYYPLISHQTYTNQFMSGVKNNLFDGSFMSMVSFFVKKEKLSEKEKQEIIEMLESVKE